jgi:hypothetical protein
MLLIDRPFLVVHLAQLVEVLPGINAGAISVIETKTYGVSSAAPAATGYRPAPA